MAQGNLPAKKYKAGERTCTKLRFTWDAGAGGSGGTPAFDVRYIDIAQCLSIINRRAYRQGLYYYVAGVTMSNGSNAYMQINTIPDTWCAKAAWLRGFRKWSQMNRKALNGSPGSVMPKYHDFKVAMHSGGTSELLPARGDVQSTTLKTGDDWVQSVFVTEDPYLHGGAASDTPVEAHNADAFTAHMLGDHQGSSGAWSSIGLIHSLRDVWSHQTQYGEPELQADFDTDPLAALFDSADVSDDVRLNLDQDNDEPPYEHDYMYGADSADETQVGAVMRTGPGSGSLVRAPGFCAPLGLLEVTTTDFGEDNNTVGYVELILDLVPGTYNGVYAERIA